MTVLWAGEEGVSQEAAHCTEDLQGREEDDEGYNGEGLLSALGLWASSCNSSSTHDRALICRTCSAFSRGSSLACVEPPLCPLDQPPSTGLPPLSRDDLILMEYIMYSREERIGSRSYCALAGYAGRGN